MVCYTILAASIAAICVCLFNKEPPAEEEIVE
jgi:hypothetical protein